MRIHWRSLRTRIIAWSFIPTTIILLAVALVTFSAYHRVTEDLVTGRNRELARLYSSQLAANLGEYTDQLVGVARMAAMYRGVPIYQRVALTRASNRLAVFDAGVVILDIHGQVVAALPGRSDVVGQDWSDRAYYRQVVRSSRPAFSDIVSDGPQGTNAIVLAVPITGEQGEFVGTMAGMFRVGATSVSGFYGGVVKLRTGDTGDAFVVDGAGRVIYHPDPDRIGSDMSGQEVVQRVLSGKVGDLRTSEFGNRDVVAAYAPVPGTSWGLVVEESWDALFSSSQSYRQFLLLLLALGVVVPVLVVTVGVGRITTPIEELIGAAREVARGKFGQTINVTTGDEIEELAQHFNHMSAQLRESYADLERKVASRTRDLSTLNAISAVVSRSLDLDEILHDALGKTLEITGMEAGGAFRLNEGSGILVLVAHQGLSDDLVQFVTHLPLKAGAAGHAARAGEPVAVDVAEISDGDLRGLCEKEGFKQVLSVPLMAKGKTLGIINLASRTQRVFGQEELSLLAGIGHQIGVAVENACLYEQAERSAVAAERSRLARDLHDAVTQTLFSASLIAEVLPRLWERNPNEGRRRLEELRELTRGALAEMRTLLLELRPSTLTEAALGDLLRQLAEAVTGRARVPVSVVVEGAHLLPPDVQIVFYRISQEALNNVAKHSGVCQVEVKLCCERDQATLSIRDNGRGFDPSEVSPEHLGLGIMRERAEAVGATVNVKSAPGQGTEVVLVWKQPKEGQDK